MTLGTLRSDDGDGNENENVIKAIVLISKTITFHAHPTLFCVHLSFLHDYEVKMPNFMFYRGRNFLSLSYLG